MLPNFWHQFSLHYTDSRGDDNFLVGAGFVGGPICPIGRNKDLAWGVTIGSHDQADAYEERVDGLKYQDGDVQRDIEVRDYTIKVLGLGEVSFQVH